MKKILLAIIILTIGGIVHATGPGPLLEHMPSRDISGAPIIYDKDIYLLDVWATWCPPCRRTIPDLINVQKKYASKGVTVIGLSVDTVPDKDLSAFVKKAGINYPIARAGDTLKYLPPVRGIPTMFIVDRNGKILDRYVGYTDMETLSQALDTALQ